MEYEIEKVNELDAHQNKLIDEHIEGVTTLKEMHVAHRQETHEMITKLANTCDSRLNRLEAPSPWKIWLKQNKLIATVVVAVLASLATLLKFWEYLSKLGE